MQGLILVPCGWLLYLANKHFSQRWREICQFRSKREDFAYTTRRHLVFVGVLLRGKRRNLAHSSPKDDDEQIIVCRF